MNLKPWKSKEMKNGMILKKSINSSKRKNTAIFLLFEYSIKKITNKLKTANILEKPVIRGGA
jgi:hypothetical protein